MNTSLRAVLTGLLLAAALPAQSKELERGILIEEQERDAKTAMAIYRGILADDDQPAGVKQQARLRLGRLLMRGGAEAEARKVLEPLLTGEGSARTAAEQILGQREETARIAAIRAEVRRILGTYDPKECLKRLRWLGPEVIPEIITQREEHWALGTAAFNTVIWAIGGAHAERYLRALPTRPAELQDVLFGGIRNDFDKSLEPAVQELIGDPRVSTSNRQRLLAASQRRLPISVFQPFCTHEEMELTRTAWQCVGKRISADREKVSLIKEMSETCQKALADPRPEVHHLVRQFLRSWGLRSKATISLVLSDLVHWPSTEQISLHNPGVTIPVQDLLVSARGVGRYDQADQRTEVIRNLALWSCERWPLSHCMDVMRLELLGYEIAAWKWMHTALKDRNRLEAVVQLAGDNLPIERFYAWMIQEPITDNRIPASCFAALRQLALRLEQGSLSVSRGNSTPQYSHPDEAYSLIAATDHPGRNDFLADRVRRASYEAHRRAALDSLVSAVRTRRNPAAIELLEEVSWKAIAEKGMTGSVIRSVTELLAGEGRPMALRLLAKFPSSLAYLAQDQKKFGVQAWQDFIDAVFDPAASGAVFHQPDAWRRLNDSKHVRITWLLTWCLSADDWYPGAKQVSEHLLDKVERLLRAKELADFRLFLLSRVLSHHGADSPRLRSLRLKALRSASRTIAMAAAEGWSSPDDPERALEEREVAAFLTFLERQEQDMINKVVSILSQYKGLDPELVERLVFHAKPAVRSAMGRRFLAHWEGSLPKPTIEKLLSAEVSHTRHFAARKIARWPAAEAVPLLLDCLEDREAGIRELATKALEAFHFQHTQSTYWARAAKQHKVDANSAAEALLAQAAPEQDQATRLLALQSLGLLAKPETLPFLIKYTKDPNQEIARAAREAITQVHQRAGGPK